MSQGVLNLMNKTTVLPGFSFTAMTHSSQEEELKTNRETKSALISISCVRHQQEARIFGIPAFEMKALCNTYISPRENGPFPNTRWSEWLTYQQMIILRVAVKNFGTPVFQTKAFF